MVRVFLGMALAIASLGAEAASSKFTLSSPDMAAGQMIAKKFVYNSFGCTGENVSPALNWSHPPVGTKSFALMVHDPDAPTGGAGFWHWIVVNVPATSTGLPQGAGALNSTLLPKGAQQLGTDYGIAAWGGPCPPVGNKPHRYDFTVYALKVDHLDIPSNAMPDIAGFMINQAMIGKATLTARYGR